MKKGMKIFAFAILGLFLISFLAGVVSAASAFGTNNPVQQIGEIFTNLFSSNSSNYDYVANILSPQVLLFILIFLIIFAVIDQISLFKEHAGISLSISIVLAILSAGFIQVDWIAPILNQYTALGVTISLILPFVLIFYFLKEIALKNRLLQKLVWGIYLAVVVMNILINWARTDSGFTRILYILILIGVGIMFWKGNKILGAIFKDELRSALAERTKEAEVSLMAQIAQDERKLEELSGVARTTLEGKIKRNKEALAKLSVD